MSHPVLEVLVKGDSLGEGLTLHTNLTGQGLCECDLRPIFGALGELAGCDPVPLELAVRKLPRPFDPRFPELRTLLQGARRDWEVYGEQLVAEVRRLYQRDRIFPLDDATLRELDRLLRDHQVHLEMKLTGRIAPGDLSRLRQRRLVVGPPGPSLVEVAFHQGRAWDAVRLAMNPEVAAAGAPSLEDLMRQVVGRKLTPRSEKALDYARRRAGIYMRRPAASARLGVERVLADAEQANMRELFDVELEAVRGATARAVEAHEDWRALSRGLKDATSGHPTLVNDMDRVARTELGFAHSWGSYTKLKDDIESAGVTEPEVFKLTRGGACRDCLRIWGDRGDPKRYKLSEVEARSFAGGNFGKHRKDWGPTIGPTHPNCTEGPLMLYDPDVADALSSIMDRYKRRRNKA